MALPRSPGCDLGSGGFFAGGMNLAGIEVFENVRKFVEAPAARTSRSDVGAAPAAMAVDSNRLFFAAAKLGVFRCGKVAR